MFVINVGRCIVSSMLDTFRNKNLCGVKYGIMKVCSNECLGLSCIDKAINEVLSFIRPARRFLPPAGMCAIFARDRLDLARRCPTSLPEMCAIFSPMVCAAFSYSSSMPLTLISVLRKTDADSANFSSFSVVKNCVRPFLVHLLSISGCLFR